MDRFQFQKLVYVILNAGHVHVESLWDVLPRFDLCWILLRNRARSRDRNFSSKARSSVLPATLLTWEMASMYEKRSVSTGTKQLFFIPIFRLLQHTHPFLKHVWVYAFLYMLWTPPVSSIANTNTPTIHGLMSYIWPLHQCMHMNREYTGDAKHGIFGFPSKALLKQNVNFSPSKIFRTT